MRSERVRRGILPVGGTQDRRDNPAVARISILRRTAASRIAVAQEHAERWDGEIVVVGATREAADDFVRGIAIRCAATFGMHRFSLPQLASRLTRLDAARRGVTPAASLMLDALTARAC